MEDSRLGLILVLVLGASWACDAGRVGKTEFSGGNGRVSDIPEFQINYQLQAKEENLTNVSRNENGCAFCEEYVTQALDFIRQKESQRQLMGDLHRGCFDLGSYRQECITLVDFHARLFFSKIFSVTPEEVCRSYQHCEEVEMSSSQPDKTREQMCQRSASDLISMMKSLDIQDIINWLLKACELSNPNKYHEMRCKRMVLKYAPRGLAETMKFLETTNMCSMPDAWISPTESVMEAPQAAISALPDLKMSTKNRLHISSFYGI